MEGEASYYLGLAHLAAGEYETALAVSSRRLFITATFNFYFIIFVLLYVVIRPTGMRWA